MPIYEVQAPDGRIISLEGPEGASPDDVMKQAQALYHPQAEVPAQAPVAAPEPQLRPRYMDPTITGPANAPDPSLGAGFMDTARNVGRKQYELSGNVFDAGANFLDDKIGQAKLGLARLFIGDDEINRRAAENPQPATLSVPPSNPLSIKMRESADQDFSNANIMAGKQAMNPVDRSGRTSIDDVIADPLNIPQVGKFGLETAVESAPEMALAAIPFVGPYLFGGSMTQGIAEERAQNQGGTSRDVSGKDLIEAAPFAAASAAAERVGIKGLGSKGGSAIARTAKAGGKEMVTEAIQEPIEYAGEVLGTDKDFDTTEAGKRSLSGALGGLTAGTGLKGGGEAVTAGANYVQNKLPQAPQRPSQDTASPTTEQATSEPVPPPPAQPEPVVPSQSTTPAQPVAPTPPVDPPAQARPEEPSQRKKAVTPDGSIEIETEDQIVSANDLQAASGDLQPRDRTRATSDMQVNTIASKLDPEQLGDSRTTDQGSPIVGPDNVVESGNGRIAAINRAKETNPEGYGRYLARLRERGYNVDGVENPVLIRRRVTDLSPEDRVRFASLSNKSQIAEMSSTEKAASDAKQIDADILDLHKGGEPDSQENQDFMRAFIQKVTTGNEAGGLIGPNKRLTQEGIKRVKAAMVAKAYDNPGLVENIFESADPEVKSIGNVLRDQAPAYAQLNAAVEAGNVPERFNITPQLMKAVETIRNAKQNNTPISEVVSRDQGSLIEEGSPDPLIDKLVEFMYRPNFGRMLSQPDLTRLLGRYADQAQEQKDSDLFGENKLQPIDILQGVYDDIGARAQERSNGQGALVDAEPDSPGAEDTGRSKAQTFADADTLADERQPRPQDDSASQDDELVKTDGRNFSDFSKKSGPNIVKNVFTDIGVSPEESVNLPPNRQLQIIKNGIESKFSLKVNVPKELDIKGAIDQLADMYVSLQFMANVLGMPASIIGLQGNLGLQLEKEGKRYLGVYRPGEQVIALPGRSNSFAHEWLHAFDDYILNHFDISVDQKLFSGVTRSDGVVDPNDSTQAAFVNLMNTIFYDKSFLASTLLDLEHKAQHGGTENARAEAQRKADQIKAGNYAGIKGKTNFYQGAKKIAKDKGYWTSPEEMLARAFEAYIGHKVDAVGGLTDGLSKGDVGYLSNVDERLAQTFPKATDRLQIFEAFDDFFARVKEAEILGKDVMPDELPDLDLAMLDPKHWDKMFPGKFDDMPLMKRFIAQEKQAYKDHAAEKKAIKKRQKQHKGLGIIREETIWNGIKQIQGDAFRSIRAVLHSFEKKYDAIDALKQANNRLVSRPGKANARSVYSSDVEKIATQHHNRIHNIGKNFNVKEWSNTEIEGIRDAMQSRPVRLKGAKKDQATRAAAGLRSVLNSLYDTAKSAGIDIGYLRNAGYLSRLYLRDKILALPEEFLEKAAEVYELQFDEIVGENPVDNIDAFIAAVQDVLKKAPENLTFDKKKFEKLVREVARAQEENIGLDKTDVPALVDELIDEVRSVHAQMAAEDWLYRIRVGREESIESTSPYSGFTKKRSLPPEADVILKDFLETDPFTIVSSYTDKMAQKVAVHNVKNPKGKKSLAKLYSDMKDKGVSRSDIEAIQNYHDTIMGLTPESASSKRAHPALSRMYTIGTLMLLGRAVVASLAEPMTFAMQTGDVKNSFRSLHITMKQILRTNDMKQINEMARAIGLVTEDFVDTTIDARLGGGLRVGVGDRAVLSGFFRNTMLTPLTNSQRSKVLKLSWLHFTDLAKQMEKAGLTETQKGQIERKMMEWGVPKNRVAPFLKWLLKQDGLPDLEKIDTPFGKMFVDAAWNLNKRTIQDPKKEDRPYYANTPAGSIIYSVTSFNFAYWENVTKAIASRLKTTADIDGNYEASKLAGKITAAYASLFAAQFVYQTLRVALTDPERWEELDEKDELMDYLLLRAFDYTAIYGPILSLLNNAVIGIRYQRDLATSFSGAHLATYFGFLEKQGKLAVQNSEDTNTAEYNAIESFFKTVVGTGIAWTLSKAPGGPVAKLAYGVGTSYATSQAAADRAATLIVGEKGEKVPNTGRKERKPRERKDRRSRGD